MIGVGTQSADPSLNVNMATGAPAGKDQTNPGVAEQQQAAYSKNGYFNPLNSGTATLANSQSAQDNSAAAGTVQQQAAAAAAGGSQGQQYYKGVSGAIGAGGPGYVQNVNNNFDLDTTPDNSSYYANAFQQQNKALDTSLAARGQYGSSAGTQQIAQADTNLAAQEGQANAAYALQRQQQQLNTAQAASSDQMNWTNSMGNLAFGAANEGMNEQQLNLQASGQQQNMQNQAFSTNLGAQNAADSMQLQIMGAGMDAASTAQGARDNRIQTGFSDELAAGSAVAQGYGNMLNNDASLASGEAGATMGAASDAYNMGQNTSNQNYLTGMSALYTGANAVGQAYGNDSGGYQNTLTSNYSPASNAPTGDFYNPSTAYA